jgi:DnaJ-class molecular chaperone
MNPQKNLYTALEVDVSATAEDIQAAYERLLQHLTSGDHGLAPQQAAAQINLLNQAYWTLSDPTRRASYDAARDSVGNEIQFRGNWETRWTPKNSFTIGGLLLLV